MENTIRYYYNLEINGFNSVDNGYIFASKNEFYYLYNIKYTDKRIKEIYELNYRMINNNIQVHEIILNSYKQIITVIDNKNYVLMRINVNLNKKITLNDIAYFNNLSITLTSKNSVASWYEKWIKKIDYYEQQAYEIGKKYPVAMLYFNYYIGYAENAISYINSINAINYNISFCHIRPSLNSLEFYNPFNLIIDYKIRDICEYIKIKFFNDKISINEIDKYIKYERFNSVDISYFYARMLFPTYYFDLFESVMDGKIDENTILNIVNKSKEYEKFMKELGIYLSRIFRIELIEWIQKSG